MTRFGRDDERGVVLVISTLVMLTLLGIAAVVLDLAMVRDDQRVATTAADFAAASGANALDAASGGNPLLACQEAWRYLQENLYDLPGDASFPCASKFTTSTVCDSTGSTPTPPTTVTAVEGPYTITMETPVPDDDPLMADPSGEPVQPEHDGTSCQRFGVEIVKHQPYLFGPAVGIGGGSTTVHAVARYTVAQGHTFPALTALDPHACPAVSAGGGFIEAYAAVNAAGLVVSPGLIYADSDGAGYPGSGQCNNAQVVLQVNGNNGSDTCFTGSVGSAGIMCAQSVPAGQPGIPAQPGVIGTYAFSVNPQYAYRPGFNYFPTPTDLAQPITREPVDAIYHCTSPSMPVGSTCPVDDIDQLNGLYANMTAASAASAGWNVVTTCSVSTALTIGPDTYVDCPDTSGGFTVKGGTVQIAAGGPVVFAGSISFSSSGGNLWVVVPGVPAGDASLSDYPASTPDTVVYLQGSGSITVTSSGSLVLPHTFVYSGAGSGGCLNIGSGSVVTWSAVAGTTSATAPFHKLMFWSEGSCSTKSTTASTFSGGGALDMDGILFSPNANFTITGSSPVDARNVQFWVNTISVSSNNAGLTLEADPNNAITVAGGVDLIR